jgi:thymidine kinase
LVGNLSSLFTTIGPATSGATQTLANVFYDLGELSNKVNVKPMFDARFNSVITSPSSA